MKLYPLLRACCITFLLLVSLAPLSRSQSLGSIEGVVVDRDTRQPIIGTRVVVMGMQKGAVTDLDGKFEITGLPPATYQLQLTGIGYQPLVKTDIAVGTAQSAKLRLEMTVNAYEGEEIVVTARTFFNKTEDTKVSSNELSQEEIRRAPGAVEDVSRMIQALPGVTSASDSRNDLIVRGGSPIENFIMIDGIEVPNINHFGTQGSSGGPIGMINVDYIQDVTFSAGGFPVKYGDKLSSTMDIRYREGDKNNLTGKLDLGLAGAGFIVEGPLQKGKSSYMFSARKSYIDLIAGSAGLNAIPNYSNFNVKATYDINTKHKLSFIGLGGIDKIKFDGRDDEDIENFDIIDVSDWQAIGGLSHQWLVGKSTFIQNSLSFNVYSKNTTLDSADQKLEFENVSSDQELTFRNDISHRFSPSDLLETGIQFKYLQNDNRIFLIETEGLYGVTQPEVNIDKVTDAFKFGSYVQYTKSFLNRYSLTTGIRYDYFDYINSPHAFSPRASLGISLSDNFNLNLATGLYQQVPPLIWMVSFEKNRDLKYIKTWQNVVGVEFYPSDDIKFTLEMFYKDYSHYAASVLNPEVSYAGISSDYYFAGYEPLLSKSNGQSKGVELFLQKKLSYNYYGLLNYSFSETRFKGLDGIDRPSAFDFTHVFTAIFGYKFTESLELSLKWRYVTGKPYTTVDLDQTKALDQLVLDNTQFNSKRHPAYHRLDIRLDKRFVFDSWNLVTFIDIQNAYNRENVEYLVWNEKKDQVEEVFQWGFLPAGGFKIEF